MMWCIYDFNANHYYWQWRGYDASLPVRVLNLEDLVSVLKEAGVIHWLQGKTLLGVFERGTLLEDHDDDVGLWASDWARAVDIVNPMLERLGFECIRNSASLVSYVRNDRYIDICLFRRRGCKAGYGNKWFSVKHFSDFDNVSFRGRLWTVPCEPAILLDEMYRPNFWRRFVQFNSRYGPKLIQFSSYMFVMRFLALRVIFKLPHSLRLLFRIFVKPLGLDYSRLTEDEFHCLLVEPIDSFNWRWRKPHLDLVTAYGSLMQVGQIIDYFERDGALDETMKRIVETDTTRPFFDPANYDPRFWQSGNNFFIYCIKFQFRRDVVPYQEANEYIKNDAAREKLYSADYYRSLAPMHDDEIESLLKVSPIEVTRGAVTSGKHRVFAMIGRLASGGKFLPIWVVRKKW